MEDKRVDPSVQSDVEELILDYLVFTATTTILEVYQNQSGKADDTQSSNARIILRLLDNYMIIYRANQPNNKCDPNLRFRLRLLKFAVLFTSRSGSRETVPSSLALQTCRQKRRKQSSSFRSSSDDVMRLDLPDLTEYLPPSDVVTVKQERVSPKANSVSTNAHNARQQPYPTQIPLLDTLPAFMSLSAAQNAMQEATITDVWMHLAAGFMVQAVAEQYLTYESHDPSVLEEAFAWGFDANCDAEEGTDEWQINAMFYGEDGVVSGWESIRDEHMHAMIPPEGIDLQEHLKVLLEGDLSIRNFEKYILSFLTGLHHSQPRPVLTQIESGKMDGLSRREVRVFKKAVGLLC